MGDTIGKRDFSKVVARKLDATNAEGAAATNAVLQSILEVFADGDRLTLTGFGTFEVKPVKARTVRQGFGSESGKIIDVPAHVRLGFSPGQEVRNLMKTRS